MKSRKSPRIIVGIIGLILFIGSSHITISVGKYRFLGGRPSSEAHREIPVDLKKPMHFGFHFYGMCLKYPT